MSRDLVNDQVIADLAKIAAETPQCDVAFRRSARFSSVLYLQPEPDFEIRALTTRLQEQWPDYPPYGGAFEDVIPHLTVMEGRSESAIDEIERLVIERLPFVSRIYELCLMVFDGESWQRDQAFAFAAANALDD